MPNPLKILIVEDNPSDAELMVRRLKNEGFDFKWVRVEDEEAFIENLDANSLDLILSDWSLPSFSGLCALQVTRAKGFDIPFIIVSGSIGEEAAVNALHPGASDYLLKDRLERLGQAVQNALEQKHLRDLNRQSEIELRIAYDSTLRGWSNALELREHETAGHSQRVVQMTMEVAQRMGIPCSELAHIQRGALLHDIGKMGIPDSILLKPGPLTEDEWKVMRMHPVHAYELLSDIPYLKPALDIPHYHHERWDGSGYPEGLKGEEIPPAARIFAIIDVWDALSHDRPYRSAWSNEKVIEYLKEQSGKHFDPRILKIFLDVINPFTK